LRSSIVSSEPICPVEPIIKIFFILIFRFFVEQGCKDNKILSSLNRRHAALCRQRTRHKNDRTVILSKRVTVQTSSHNIQSDRKRRTAGLFRIVECVVHLNDNVLQTAATGKYVLSNTSNICHAARNSDGRQVAAAVKNIISNACHAVRNDNKRQATATIKSPPI
jgi:hypothetical protein